MKRDPFTPWEPSPGDDRFDILPGFWGSHHEPGSQVAGLVQAPVYRINADSLSVAYMRDWRRARRSALSEAEEGRE